MFLQFFYMHDKISLECWNLLAHLGILSLEFPGGLGSLRVEVLYIVDDVLFIFHNSAKAENSQD